MCQRKSRFKALGPLVDQVLLVCLQWARPGRGIFSLVALGTWEQRQQRIKTYLRVFGESVISLSYVEQISAK